MNEPSAAWGLVGTAIRRRVEAILEAWRVDGATFDWRSGMYATTSRPLSIWISLHPPASTAEAAAITVDVFPTPDGLEALIGATADGGRVLAESRFPIRTPSDLARRSQSTDDGIDSILQMSRAELLRITG